MVTFDEQIESREKLGRAQFQIENLIHSVTLGGERRGEKGSMYDVRFHLERNSSVESCRLLVKYSGKAISLSRNQESAGKNIEHRLNISKLCPPRLSAAPHPYLGKPAETLLAQVLGHAATLVTCASKSSVKKQHSYLEWKRNN